MSGFFDPFGSGSGSGGGGIGPQGPVGPQGPAGKDGKDGKDGTSVSNAEINNNGQLIITLSDGTSFNAGNAKGEDGQDGQDGAPGADGKDGKDGTNGQNGAPGNGISSVSKTSTEGNVDTYTISFTNGTSTTFTVTNGINGTNGTNGHDGADGKNGQDGAPGLDGVGILDIQKTSTVGLVDTYTITLTDNSTETFTVTNGEKGDPGSAGQNGAPGADGISITGASIDANGHLILTLSQGPAIDTGVAKGADGTSITIIDNLSSTSELPSTGQHNGDAYLINGDLWIYTGGSDPDMVNGFKNVGRIQGPAGRGISGVAITNGDLYVTYTDDPGNPVRIGPVQGAAGRGITSIAKTDTTGLVDTYTITYSDNTTSTFTVTNGAAGQNGANGQDGKDGEDGEDGIGIYSITKTGTDGLVDTYTITYTNGNTGTFTVTNGANGTNGTNGTNGNDGRGIASITGPVTVGLVDTYTINFTDGQNPVTFTVTNGDDGAVGATGNGISSITGPVSAGLVDTYTINFTDGTHTTFAVTNGAAGQNGLGIKTIAYTSSSGAVDTYTITYTDDTTSTFTVTNGIDGDDGISITNTTITNEHLIVTLSNGSTIDAGSVTLRSTQYSFSLLPANWVQQQDGSYLYTLTNANIKSTDFIDVGPANGITENQLNGLLGAKLIIESVNTGNVVFRAYGEKPSIEVPMLLVVEGSYLAVTPVITVDDELSSVSTNPVENRVVTNALAAKADQSQVDIMQEKCDLVGISDNLLQLGGLTVGTGYSGAKRSDGSVIVTTDGSQRGGSGTFEIDIVNTIPAGTYQFSGCIGGSNNSYYMDLYDKNGGRIAQVKDGETSTFTVNSPTELKVIIAVTGGLQITDKLFYPMLCSSSVTTPTFSRSTNDGNIKTISGYDRVDVVIDDSYAYQLLEVTVMSRNTPGQVIKEARYWIETSSGIDRITSIFDTTSEPEGPPTFTKYYDSNGKPCVKVTDTYGNRDFVVKVMKY